MLLRFRFASSMTIADIARVMNVPQRPLYRRLEALLSRLKQQLAQAGLDAAALGEVIGRPAARIDFGWKSDEPLPSSIHETFSLLFDPYMINVIQPSLRAAIYARVSTEEQKEGQTIDSQVAELERFAAGQFGTITPSRLEASSSLEFCGLSPMKTASSGATPRRSRAAR